MTCRSKEHWVSRLSAISHLLTNIIYLFYRFQCRPINYFSICLLYDIVPFCPHGPVILHKVWQSVRPFVRARHLFSLMPPTPHLPLFLFSDNWGPEGDVYVCLRERCKKGRKNKDAGLEKRFCASQWLSFGSLLINGVCLISGVFFSVPLMWKRWCTMNQEALLDKRHCCPLYMLPEPSFIFMTGFGKAKVLLSACVCFCREIL